MEHRAESTVDYLKFVIVADVDLWQSHWWPQLDALDEKLRLFAAGAPRPKVTIPRVQSSGRRTYVVECWGSTANYLAMNVPAAWWSVVRRVDVRQELRDIAADGIKALGVRLTLQPKSSVTVSTIGSKPAKRTNAREHGGVGVRLGSRSSESHVVVYKRGNEAAVVEYRSQDKQAQKIGSAVYERYALHGPEVRFAAIVREVTAARDKFLNKHIGVEDHIELAHYIRASARAMPASGEWLTQAEMDFEQNVWNEMSTEEQDLLQGQTWSVTPKGAQHLS